MSTDEPTPEQRSDIRWKVGIIVVVGALVYALMWFNPMTCQGRSYLIKERERPAWRHENCERIFPFDIRERDRRPPKPEPSDG